MRPLLALAGLNRLGKAAIATFVLEPSELLPAAGQGAIGLMCRAVDERVKSLLKPLNDRTTFRCVSAERAMLDVLDGSCRTPIGGLAQTDDTTMTLRGLIAKPDGSALIETAKSGPADHPEQLGRAVGGALLAQAGSEFLAEVR